MVCGSGSDSSSLVKGEVVGCGEHPRYTHSYRRLWLEISRQIKFPFPLPPSPKEKQPIYAMVRMSVCVLNRITGGRALSKQ